MKKVDLQLKILKIYKNLILNRQINRDDIINLYIEYLKLCMILGTNNPSFEDDIGKYDLNTNCYCYALGITFPKIFYKKYMKYSIEPFCHNLGFASRHLFAATENEKLENFYRDLDVLNIKYYESGLNQDNFYGGYKIALYLSRYDFHFLRQNVDGSWSEKRGYAGNVIKRDMIEPKYGSYKLKRVLEIVKPI